MAGRMTAEYEELIDQFKLVMNERAALSAKGKILGFIPHQ